MVDIISEKTTERLEKTGYRFVGKHKHSAVKVCLWTKNSLRGQGVCYKQKFYGIQSHRCLQMTPALPFCKHRCKFCWRDISITNPEWKGPYDSPEEIIEGSIEAQRELLSGFKGNEEADKKKWKEAQNPNQVAISLAGEPTEYPMISELVQSFKDRKFSVFLVSNGTNPHVIEKLTEPTNLYITLPAPDYETYIKTCNPVVDSWDKIMKSLSFLKNFSCKTVIRLTLVKDLNLIKPELYAKIVDKYEPDFLEVKSFMSVGFSRTRLPYTAMPLHEEIQEFAQKIQDNSSYKIKDESRPSRIVLLSK
ncbi:MAG: 4-demethylwyosine synthase TYW1 [Candidatus Aenigmarchaeota archaeon]|nr:4-demethylwyosine synthase TYW1 [Candidatus Aenigmarchaeota archaeon]